MLSAITSALANSIKPEWFQAIADSEEEGQALFNLHQAMSDVAQQRGDF